MLRIEIQVPASQSLKEKRRPVKSLIANLENRFHCAAAEVDFQDLHQRAAIGVALVAGDGQFLAQRLLAVKEYVQTLPEALVLQIQEQQFRMTGEP